MKFKKQPLNDITFEITDVCQLRCKRCSIWRGAGRHEIAPAFFMATMKRLLEVFRVYSVSLTGGEPFLYPKIAELLKYLALLRTGKKITGFGIYTSGVNTEIIDKVMRGSRSFLQGMDCLSYWVMRKSP